MPFEPGHKLSRNVRLVDGMIRRVLAQDIAEAEKDGSRPRLRRAIEAQLDKAASGELPSLDWIVTRLEGKPVQSVQMDDDSMPVFKGIRMIVVDQIPNEIKDITPEVAHDVPILRQD
jgi:hypothetical protein